MTLDSLSVDCPFCKEDVEIITIQRDENNRDIVNVVYYHSNGDKHFTIYRPVTSVNGPRS